MDPKLYKLNLKGDICPHCRVVLVYDDKVGKLVCPKFNCKFVDRRLGDTMIDPARDRRRSLSVIKRTPTAEDSEDIWGKVEWAKY